MTVGFLTFVVIVVPFVLVSFWLWAACQLASQCDAIEEQMLDDEFPTRGPRIADAQTHCRADAKGFSGEGYAGCGFRAANISTRAGSDAGQEDRTNAEAGAGASSPSVNRSDMAGQVVCPVETPTKNDSRG